MQKEIDETLRVVMLTEHKNKFAETLSGGMKRKLSLAMAIIGGSKLIILDEPSSGLDVESRRQVWDLIRKIKAGRSIIMSTQHLEEADELADRVCVMSKGKILALDTPFAIKKQFGVGYNLLIEPRATIEFSQFTKLKPDLDRIVSDDDIIQGVIESHDSSDKKYMYIIPFDQQKNIPQLLNELGDSYAD